MGKDNASSKPEAISQYLPSMLTLPITRRFSKLFIANECQKIVNEEYWTQNGNINTLLSEVILQLSNPACRCQVAHLVSWLILKIKMLMQKYTLKWDTKAEVAVFWTIVLPGLLLYYLWLPLSLYLQIAMFFNNPERSNSKSTRNPSFNAHLILTSKLHTSSTS